MEGIAAGWRFDLTVLHDTCTCLSSSCEGGHIKVTNKDRACGESTRSARGLSGMSRLEGHLSLCVDSTLRFNTTFAASQKKPQKAAIEVHVSSKVNDLTEDEKRAIVLEERQGGLNQYKSIISSRSIDWKCFATTSFTCGISMPPWFLINDRQLSHAFSASFPHSLNVQIVCGMVQNPGTSMRSANHLMHLWHPEWPQELGHTQSLIVSSLKSLCRAKNSQCLLTRLSWNRMRVSSKSRLMMEKIRSGCSIMLSKEIIFARWKCCGVLPSFCLITVNCQSWISWGMKPYVEAELEQSLDVWLSRAPMIWSMSQVRVGMSVTNLWVLVGWSVGIPVEVLWPTDPDPW